VDYKHGILDPDAFADVTARFVLPPDSADDDELQLDIDRIIDVARDSWRVNGCSRSWADNTGHVLAIQAADYREATARLRRSARSLDASVRVGRVTGPAGSQIYIPFMVTDRPPARPPRVNEVPAGSALVLTASQWETILATLEREAAEATDAGTARKLTELVSIIASVTKAQPGRTVLNDACES
jgi:hypothetical protein